MAENYRPWTWKIPESDESTKSNMIPRQDAYGIGENIGACLSGITSSAIYNAIGKWVRDYPTTPDKVLKALGKI